MQNRGLSPIPAILATERIYASQAKAVSQIFENLERDICERCTARIFRECKRVPRRNEGMVPIETGAGRGAPAQSRRSASVTATGVG